MRTIDRIESDNIRRLWLRFRCPNCSREYEVEYKPEYLPLEFACSICKEPLRVQASEGV